MIPYKKLKKKFKSWKTKFLKSKIQKLIKKLNIFSNNYLNNLKTNFQYLMSLIRILHPFIKNYQKFTMFKKKIKNFQKKDSREHLQNLLQTIQIYLKKKIKKYKMYVPD